MNDALVAVLTRAAARCENPIAYIGDDSYVLRSIAHGLSTGRLELVDKTASSPPERALRPERGDFPPWRPL